jgi:hypothetical protein
MEEKSTSAQSTNNDLVHVLIKHRATKKVEKKMGPMTVNRAERVARGASINLHNDYEVVVE